MTWFHILGLDSPSSPWYLFWSGAGSDASKLSMFSALLLLWWKHRCHVRMCWRTGRYAVAGTPWVVCAHHHPKDTPSAHDIVLAPNPEQVIEAVDDAAERKK